MNDWGAVISKLRKKLKIDYNNFTQDNIYCGLKIPQNGLMPRLWKHYQNALSEIKELKKELKKLNGERK